MKIALIGAGKVGTTLALAFKKAGHQITAVLSRRQNSALKLARKLGVKIWGTDLKKIPLETQVVFLTVPDREIKKTVRKLIKILSLETLVIHCSGALTSDELRPFKKRASMHPLQTFAHPELTLKKIPQTYFGLEGNEFKTVKKLVESLGASYLEIPKNKKTAYHLAGVFASNYLVGIIDLALRLFRKIGCPEKKAFQALTPLIEGTLENIEKLGMKKALTGPVKRKDFKTIKKHLEYLQKNQPETVEVYQALKRILERMLSKK